MPKNVEAMQHALLEERKHIGKLKIYCPNCRVKQIHDHFETWSKFLECQTCGWIREEGDELKTA